MAETTFATGNALTVQLWAKELLTELPKEIFWSQYMDKGVGSPVQVKEDLGKSPGDKITIGLRMQLSGAGVSGDSDLEGSEESMTFYNQQITINQKRHAVKLAGRMTEKRVAFNLRMEGKDALKEWLARNIDDDFFAKLGASPTKVIFAGSATSTATVTAADYLTLALLSRARAYGRTASPLLRPVKVGGEAYWLAVIHPHQGYDLKINDASYAQALREAERRGKDNPLFSGAYAVWDNVVIKDHASIATTTNWGAGANVAGAEALFLGAQATCLAWGEYPFWNEKAFDYNAKVGFAIGAIWGIQKMTFNSKDFGTVMIRTARTNIS